MRGNSIKFTKAVEAIKSVRSIEPTRIGSRTPLKPIQETLNSFRTNQMSKAPGAKIHITGDFVFDLHLKLYKFSSKTLDIGSGKIHYFEKRVPNERGVFVFLHGIGASAGHYNHMMVLAQKAGYSVLAPDMPSHGFSSDLNTVLTSDIYYKAFVEWTEKVAPEKFVLIGNSLGGGVSLKFALEYPHRLNNLIIASPAGGFEKEEDWVDFRDSIVVDSISDSKRFLSKLFHRSPLYLPLIYFPFYNAMNRKGVKDLLRFTTFEEIQVPSSIPELFPPTLLIWGKSERLFPSQNLVWFKEFLNKNALIEEPSGIGHCPHMDNPKWFHDRIMKFVGI